MKFMINGMLAILFATLFCLSATFLLIGFKLPILPLWLSMILYAVIGSASGILFLIYMEKLIKKST